MSRQIWAQGRILSFSSPDHGRFFTFLPFFLINTYSKGQLKSHLSWLPQFCTNSRLLPPPLASELWTWTTPCWPLHTSREPKLHPSLSWVEVPIYLCYYWLCVMAADILRVVSVCSSTHTHACLMRVPEEWASIMGVYLVFQFLTGFSGLLWT